MKKLYITAEIPTTIEEATNLTSTILQILENVKCPKEKIVKNEPGPKPLCEHCHRQASYIWVDPKLSHGYKFKGFDRRRTVPLCNTHLEELTYNGITSNIFELVPKSIP